MKTQKQSLELLGKYCKARLELQVKEERESNPNKKLDLKLKIGIATAVIATLNWVLENE